MSKRNSDNTLSENEPASKKQKISDDNEIDPLDAFMASINATTKKQRRAAHKKQKEISKKSEFEFVKTNLNSKKQQKKLELDSIDPMNEFINQMQSNNPMFIPSSHGEGYNSDEEVYRIAKMVEKEEESKKELANKLKKKEIQLKYDDYGNIITPMKDRLIEYLPPINHNKIFYTKFNKNFYTEHPQITNMNDKQLKNIKNELNIKTEGNNIPKPVVSFAHFGFNEKLMNIIINENFEKPTPIQCQAIPCSLSGRDILGISKTGSGKTNAFLWPVIPHVLDQIEVNGNPIQAGVDGPIVVIIAPTRELAEQIYGECIKYLIPFGISIGQLYGGLQMHKQRLKLKKGCEIVIGTPGRIIDMIKDKSMKCYRITYVIIDECDRMFNMGFEQQIRSIIGQIRPTKQISLFSATMNPKIENLAKDVLNNYIKINIGEQGLVNEDITQIINIMDNDTQKIDWVKKYLHIFTRNGLVLIFVNSKLKCEKISRVLNDYCATTFKDPIKVDCIHGDKLQHTRHEIMEKYKNNKIKILIATDIVSRGLDIHSIQTIINFDVATNMDTHTHRIGRTGRGNDKKGVAYTLLDKFGEKDKIMAPKLLKMLSKLNMYISDQLKEMVYGKNVSNNNNNNGSIVKRNKNIGNDIDFEQHLKKNMAYFEKKQAIDDAKNTYYKNGFDTNVKAAKQSFKSSFVKAKSNEFGQKKKSRWDEK